MTATLARNGAAIARNVYGFDPFETLRRTWAFDYDVTRTEAGYQVELPVPGFNAAHIEVLFKDGVLAVNGKNDRRTFSRSFTVPEDVDVNTIEAQVADGLLTLTLQRKAEAQPKRIEVK
jgi:HSP20 family protein